MSYSWNQSDVMLALLNGSSIVWQLNFDPREGKPYFHPITSSQGQELTALRPSDHPWHRGIWWSWKFINGLNYWEEDANGVSEGLTTLRATSVETRPDFSATIQHLLEYHPPDCPPSLTEKRRLAVSAPDEAGGFTIDWQTEFTAGDTAVHLARTPIAGEPHGMSWGGYAGLSVRLSSAAERRDAPQDGEGRRGAPAIHGQCASWVEYAGIRVEDHPGNPGYPSYWYVWSDGMHYFGPAILFLESRTMPPGSRLEMNYRLVVTPS